MSNNRTTKTVLVDYVFFTHQYAVCFSLWTPRKSMMRMHGQAVSMLVSGESICSSLFPGWK